MPLKFYRPVTPTLRWQAISDFSDIEPKNKRPEKKLVETLHKKGGRNNMGRITSRGKGGGHKRKYRIIDFKRAKDGVKGKVAAIEYDPNRSARIALIEYADKEKCYILHPVGLKVGDVIESGSGLEPNLGNCMPIGEIPEGTFIHNIEFFPGKGAQIARSAGSYAILMAKDGGYAHIKLPSGEVRLVPINCRATIGQVGNIEYENYSWGKAGRTRWRGWRPLSRAVVMNPVDHPMGGGEGKSSGGRHPCSPWGQIAKGLKTRKRSKTTNKFIVVRRTKKIQG